MKSLISFKVFLLVFLSSKFVTSQTPDNPWSIGIGANTVQVLDESVESKNGFGPSVSIGRYLGAGFSIGANYGINKFKIDNINTDYTSVDAFLKFNFSSKKFSPYLIGGYGLSDFGKKLTFEGVFKSLGAGRTIHGGLGFDISISNKISLNIRSAYRWSEEKGTYKHLQHVAGFNYNFGQGDSDKDGVPDNKDTCPEEPGLKEFNGCPDTDGDKIPDNKDNCPEEFGPVENNGCPWSDRDEDGVFDKDDNCPDVPGAVTNAGCPEYPIEGLEELSVKFGSDSFEIDPTFEEQLAEAFRIIEANSTAKIIIEGHADSTGNDQINLPLSELRAMRFMHLLNSLRCL